MIKTVQELAKTRTRAFTVLAVLLLSLTITVFALDSNPYKTILIVYCLAITFFCIVYISYLYQVRDRLVYLSVTAMEPHLLQSEAEEAYRGVGNSWKARYGRLYYQSAYYALIGEFDKSYDIYQQIPAPTAKIQNAKECALLLALVRSSKLDEAAVHLDAVQGILAIDPQLVSSCYRAIGAYHVAVGSYEEGGLLLKKAWETARYNVEKLGIQFSLAELSVKENNVNQAIEHYQLASALGPKTWMGQEAARRVEGLLSAGMQQT